VLAVDLRGAFLGASLPASPYLSVSFLLS
jgi:hypothetical protein